MRCKITENNSYTQVFATKIAQKAKYLTLSVYFHYVNDHFAAEPRYVGHSAVTPRAEPIAEHTKADAAAKSHDNVRYILSKGLSMTAWQPYPPPILEGANRRFYVGLAGHVVNYICLLALRAEI